MDEASTIELHLEVDGSANSEPVLSDETWAGSGSYAGIEIRLIAREEGHGFGLSEFITIAISIASGASSQLVAEAVKEAVSRLIIRVRGRSVEGDGSQEGIAGVVEDERTQASSIQDEENRPADRAAGQ